MFFLIWFTLFILSKHRLNFGITSLFGFGALRKWSKKICCNVLMSKDMQSTATWIETT